jgi:hypothetical protein
MNNKTHGQFQDVLAIAKPELRPVCEALRRLVASSHGGFVEVVWPNHGIASYGVGPKKMTQHYAYIGVQNSHINLGFYHGATLRDPDGLLEGSGKKLRHVKVRDVAATKTTALVALLRQAIADRSRLAPRA